MQFSGLTEQLVESGRLTQEIVFPRMVEIEGVSRILGSLDTSRIYIPKMEIPKFPVIESNWFDKDSAYFQMAKISSFFPMADSLHELISDEAIVQNQEVRPLLDLAYSEFENEVNLIESFSKDSESADPDISILVFDSSVPKIISSVDSSLEDIWNGAISSLQSDNPDKVRHVTTSIRELLGHLLRTVAPDSEVAAWAEEQGFKGNNQYFYDKGVTRSAKLNYLYRELNHGSFQSYFANDVKAVLNLIDTLNSGTHGLGQKFTDQQLTFLMIRLESMIRTIPIVRT